MNLHMVKTLVRGDHVITNPLLGAQGVKSNESVAIDTQGKIAEIGDTEELSRKYPHAAQEGGRHRLILPGLIDAHCHGKGLTHFELGLGYHHLEYWNTKSPFLPQPDPYLDALWCGIKHIKSGCTTLHHMNNTMSFESSEAAIRAYNDLGMRWAFSINIKDQNLITYDDDSFLPMLPSGLREKAEAMASNPDLGKYHDQYFEILGQIRAKYHSSDHPVILGPMGPQWCTETLISKIKMLSEKHKMRIHMHALQTPYQRLVFLKKFGHSGIVHLKKMGILDSNLTLGHCVWLDESDIERLAENRVSITHHASCNLNMRNGIMPLDRLLKRGITVAVGIDDKGINDDNDMIQELRVIDKLHRVCDYTINDSLPIKTHQIAAMATIQGARVLGIENTCGTLEVGKAADLIVVDVSPRPWLHPEVSPYDKVIMRSKAQDIESVFIGGDMVMKGGCVLSANEQEVATELARSISQNESAETRSKARLYEKLQPYISQFYETWDLFPNGTQPFYWVNRKR
jgi:5-methylthioadenosine/S-adenosylhomocysteine deaminase